MDKLGFCSHTRFSLMSTPALSQDELKTLVGQAALQYVVPGEVVGAIGTSTLFAAWNAAIYVAQIEDHRLSEVVKNDRYLEATEEVLQKYGGLWFNDESFVISRRQP